MDNPARRIHDSIFEVERSRKAEGTEQRMKTYTCVCGQLLFFQNVACVNCKRELGFLPEMLMLSSLDPEVDSLWRPTTEAARDKRYGKCQNYSAENVCNWMVPQEDKETFCVSCRLNEVIPNLSEQNRQLWALIENAKRRLVYSLIQLKLPIANRKDDPQQGLSFRFLADTLNTDGNVAKVMTGHNQGTITLNIAEADDSTREKMRHTMNEPYRTLLGHFRHESGHYYWERLIRNTQFLDGYRNLFGYEETPYDQALNAYYQSGAPANWQDSYITAYATAHPWEDWAETWAHFLHIHDALEVARDFGLVGKRILMQPDNSRKSWLSSKETSFDQVIKAWSELAVALNSMNRSMGQPDLYPFVLSQRVVAKLRFVHEAILASAPAVNQNPALAGAASPNA